MNRQTFYGILRRTGAILALVCAQARIEAMASPLSPAELAVAYRSGVEPVLTVPPEDLLRYRELAEQALAAAQADLSRAQYVLVVDRSPLVQASLLFWRSGAADYRLVGASPVSTGRRGSFDHFRTPLGVFDHSPSNPDFRAEGTFNSNGIRGYGLKGMRVYDFGWQQVPKGWGDEAVVEMRLQMHATDPDRLAPRLGTEQSKGCVRIPAGLNQLLDHFGVLDAQYQQEAAAGHPHWILKADAEPVADPGRYLVIVDSGTSVRPAWARPAARLVREAPPARAPAR